MYPPKKHIPPGLGEGAAGMYVGTAGRWECRLWRRGRGGQGRETATFAASSGGQVRSQEQWALVVPRGGLGPAGVSRGQSWRCLGGTSVLPVPRGGSPGGASGGLRSCRCLAGTHHCDCGQSQVLASAGWRILEKCTDWNLESFSFLAVDKALSTPAACRMPCVCHVSLCGVHHYVTDLSCHGLLFSQL